MEFNLCYRTAVVLRFKDSEPQLQAITTTPVFLSA